MAGDSQQELERRRRSVASVLGTHAMEGLTPDAPTLDILRRYETGQLSLEQFTEAMTAHAQEVMATRGVLAGAA